MKRIFFILALLATLPLYSEWLPNGNNVKLNTSGDKIRDFVISEDSKFIYTLADSGIIAKWNAESGEQIFKRQLQFLSGSDSTYKWIFLSKDAKTICWGSSYWNASSLQKYIYIMDIETNSILDSFKLPNPVYSQYISVAISYNILDFNSQKNIFVIAINDSSNSGRGYSTTGDLSIYLNSFGDWKLISYSPYKNNFIVCSNQYDKCFKLGEYKSYDIQSGYPGRYISKDIQYYKLTDLLKLKNDSICNRYYYYYYGPSDINLGALISYNSGIFSNDSKYLLLSSFNRVLQYTTEPFNTLHIKTFPDIYLSIDSIRLFNSNGNSNCYLAKGNTLSIYRIDSLLYCNSIIIDSVKSLNKAINSNDSLFCIIQDNNRSIYKIPSIEILLRSHFTSGDSIYTTAEQAQFYECATGFPDKYYWDFGDYSYSEQPNPTHQYKLPGFYSVKLKIYRGNNFDSTVKEKFIHVIPTLKADFGVSVYGNFPVKAEFYNWSVGDIDSVYWNFGDGESSRKSNPVHYYKTSGEYKVTLFVYSNNHQSYLSKKVKISAKPDPLNNTIFPYEIIDTNRIGAYAKKGYENLDNSIIYQINKDSLSYVGGKIYNNKIWERLLPKNWWFLRKQNGSNLYYFNSYDSSSKTVDTIIYFDNNGDEIAYGTTGSNYKYYPSYAFDVTTFANRILIFNNVAYWMEFNVTNYNDTVTYGLGLGVQDYDNYHNYSLIYKKAFGYCTDTIIDYCRNHIFTASYYDNNHENTSTYYVFVVNKKKYDYQKVDDLMRLNKQSLIFIANDHINYIRNYGANVNDTTNYIYLTKSIAEYTFKSLLKLNDTAFAVAGSYRGSPSVAIFNDKGSMIDSVTLSDRFGEFEFISLTPDNKLLLSGYRYMTYGVKSPYFVKFGDETLANLMSKSDIKIESTVRNDLSLKCFPNPTNGLTTISFNLPEPSHLTLNIYDAFGNKILSDSHPSLNTGENTFEFDLSPFATGYYFYALETASGTFTGKVMNVK